MDCHKHQSGWQLVAARSLPAKSTKRSPQAKVGTESIPANDEQIKQVKEILDYKLWRIGSTSDSNALRAVLAELIAGREEIERLRNKSGAKRLEPEIA